MNKRVLLRALSAALLLSAVSCYMDSERSLLKLEVARAGSECPYELTGLGAMTSVTLDHDVVCCDVNVTTARYDLDFATLKENARLIKVRLLLLSGEDDERLYMFTVARNAGAAVRYTFTVADTITYTYREDYVETHQFAVNLSHDDLTATLSHKLRGEDAYRALLDTIIAVERENVPRQLGNNIRLTDIDLENGNLTYKILTNSDTYDWDIVHKKRHDLHDEVLADLITDNRYSALLDACIECDVTITHRYVSRQGTVTVIITPEQMYNALTTGTTDD